MLGERYAEQCRAGFVEEIIPQVHSWDFAAALAFYQNVTPTLSPAEIALLGCNDRFFLLTALLHRKDATHPWVYARCREVEAAPDGYLDLWARYHYKSTLITFAGTLQEIINNPEIKIGIFAATNKVAKPFLSQIMEELESNTQLKAIYADVLWQAPRKEAKRWALDRGIVLRRVGNPREPTVGAYGLIDGMPTGYHHDILIYDDLVTAELVTNDEMVTKVTDRWELSDNLGVGGATRKWHVGTRYSYHDTYGELLADGRLIPRLYPATHNGKMDDYYTDAAGKKHPNPVFMSIEDWQKVKRAQKKSVAAQMLQNPLAGGISTFEPATLRPYVMRPRTINVYILVDSSQGLKNKNSDRTAMAVVGVDDRSNKYLLDGYCHRMTLSETWTNLKSLYLRWRDAPGVQLIRVGYEKYGKDRDIQYLEERMQEKDEPTFAIEEVNFVRELSDQSKEARISRLEPDFTHNAFYLPGKVWVAHVGVLGPRVCLWEVKPDTPEPIVYRPIALRKIFTDDKGKIVPGSTYIDDAGRTRKAIVTESKEVELLAVEQEAQGNGEGYRIVQAIRRLDEHQNAYDLTAMFFQEFLRHPKGLHDDLIDAVSRIYDLQPAPAIILSREMLEPPVFSD